jgi:superfamily I DNA and/or RNA helicase
MNVISQFVKFLQEYKKLLERGVKDVLSSNVAVNFLWINEIEDLIKDGICESQISEIFTNNLKIRNNVLRLRKPLKPKIYISEKFLSLIEFNEAKNKFESLTEDDEILYDFLNSEEGKNELFKIEKFKKNKEIYSKFYRAYNDIKNDSNIEIVLSVGFIQYSKLNNNGNLSKTNQHLFHFPISISIDSENIVNLSFSEFESPYVDFFFLNNTPIQKEELSNIIDRFDECIKDIGYEYLFEDSFKMLIAKSLQMISSNSDFENSIFKPSKDHYREDYFKISFSPAINIKYKKPRFFEKLTESIIKLNDENEIEAKLFNLLVRNPESSGLNSYTKSNYFKDELFESFKSKVKHLNGEEDFSVFFPLPFNKEQKQIYENYLKNRLTVVTGPPGTGKSHTIVNILCSLLAQGKKVLVTAQTDKALESLLNKIPRTFDDLIFTKIQLEIDQNRFSLEKSIENISKILTENYQLNIESKILELDKLKSEYVKLKSEIIHVLEKEYSEISINDTFSNLKPYQIVEKFELKDAEEWMWIKDSISIQVFSDFDLISEKIIQFKELSKIKFKYQELIGSDISSVLKKIESFDFKNYLTIQTHYYRILDDLEIDELSKDIILKTNLDRLIETAKKYSNSDIVLKNLNDIDEVLSRLNFEPLSENYIINRSFSDIISNGSKYLNDIETYFSFLKNDTPSFITKLTSASFEKVSYLEQFTLNGVKCNNRNEIDKLKKVIKKTIEINNCFTLLKQKGFSFFVDDNNSLYENTYILKEVIGKVQRNKEIISKIQFENDFIYFSELYKIDWFDIDLILRKAIALKNNIDKLNTINSQLTSLRSVLNFFEDTIEHSVLKSQFVNYFPITDIDTAHEFEKFLIKIKEISKQIQLEETYNNLKNELIILVPETILNIHDIPDNYITKENFEFSQANEFIKKYGFVNLQKCKEELTFINEKILKVKCEILFDLAKSNFKNEFQEEKIDNFINLLKKYRINTDKSKQGIKDKIKFQILSSQNSIEISKKLSCWIMRFNDVLNSVGSDPEIFDCIIVDEASQLDFNSLLLGYYSKNMIVVGDDKQTSPTALNGAESNSFNTIKNDYLDYLGAEKVLIRSDLSLFSLSEIVAGTANVELREHFRCVPEIIEFSRREFYNNKLRPLKQINSNRLNPKETIFVKDAFLENKIVFKEIEEIKIYLKRILKEKQYQDKTIGVVSLGLANHTEKLKDIKEELSSEFGKDKIDKHKLIIEDSPKFQGDERDVMIVSLGVAIDLQALQSNQDSKPRAIVSNQDEFKKINVALSRAKEQMILFHSVNSEHLKPNDFRNKILNFFNENIIGVNPLIIQNYNIQRTKYNIPEPFDSWFEYDIAKALIEKGYSYIQPQYKVKEDETFYNPRTNQESWVKFYIDLVVHNNGKMVAIECDGDPFHSLPEDVAYDIERQEFLERVGWKVYRILYSAFKRNPQEEIQKLINFVEKNTQIDNYLTFQKLDKIDENLDEKVEIENDIDENLYFFEPKEKDIESVSIESEVICYFNLYFDNTYKIQDYSDSNCMFSIPIRQKHINGYLLQCYDNGHINKVNVKSIVNKQKDYHYQNGKNPDANIIYLKLIDDDSIIALKLTKNNEVIFKAHKTENISNRDLLQLQGIKVVYSQFDKIEFKVLPIKIYEDIKRLVYSSFNAEGKSIFNNYYQNEWDIIKMFFKITE